MARSSPSSWVPNLSSVPLLPRMFVLHQDGIASTSILQMDKTSNPSFKFPFLKISGCSLDCIQKVTKNSFDDSGSTTENLQPPTIRFMLLSHMRDSVLQEGYYPTGITRLQAFLRAILQDDRDIRYQETATLMFAFFMEYIVKTNPVTTSPDAQRLSPLRFLQRSFSEAFNPPKRRY